MKNNVLTLLENSRKYTLDVAMVMPEAMYRFKPSPEIWTFGEQMNHIAYGIQWMKSNYVLMKASAWEPPLSEKVPEKDEVEAYLVQAYNSWAGLINQINLTDDVLKGVYATLDHITHHRGQAIIYLRMNGITPPEYVC